MNTLDLQPYQLFDFLTSVNHTLRALCLIMGAYVFRHEYIILRGARSFERDSRKEAFSWMCISGAMIFSAIGLIIMSNPVFGEKHSLDSNFLLLFVWGFFTLSTTLKASIIAERASRIWLTASIFVCAGFFFSIQKVM